MDAIGYGCKGINSYVGATGWSPLLGRPYGPKHEKDQVFYEQAMKGDNYDTGDINGNHSVDLYDAVVAIRVSAGMDTSGGTVQTTATLNQIRVELTDAVFIPGKTSDIR